MRTIFISFILFFASQTFASDRAVYFAKKLENTIGKCVGCKISPTSRAAGDHPLGKTTLKDLHGRKITATVMNDEYALKLFQQMTVQQKIPFGFPEDGCYARAHEMSFQLEKKKIATGKVFAHGFFRIDDDKASRGYVSWIFHVAPFVVVDTGKTKQIWVIDPSLFAEPVSLEAWLSTLTAHPKSKLSKVYLTSRYNYHWKDRDEVLKAFDEDDLSSARRTMKRYRKREDQREKAKTPEL